MLIPGMIYGHKAAKAQYNGAEIPPAPIAYLAYVYYIYIVFLCLSVIWATYKSFRKKNSFQTRNIITFAGGKG